MMKSAVGLMRMLFILGGGKDPFILVGPIIKTHYPKEDKYG